VLVSGCQLANEGLLILNQGETFGSLGNRIELPLFEVDLGRPTIPRGSARRVTVGGKTNLALLGASDGRR
jgi:hypothetical protein